jgi:hypothetical protein
MADVRMLAFFWFPRLDWLGGGRALENVPTGLFVRTDHDAPLLIQTERLDRKLTEVVGLGFEVRIVAIEPVHAPMWLEVGLLQDTPQTGATHRRALILLESRDQIIKTPPGGWTMIRGGLLGRDG